MSLTDYEISKIEDDYIESICAKPLEWNEFLSNLPKGILNELVSVASDDNAEFGRILRTKHREFVRQNHRTQINEVIQEKQREAA